MFDLDNEKVEGIVAEEGGMSSHAAILARGMGIPTVTGIRDLPKLLRNGDLVVLDATAGELVTAPDDRALAEATAAGAALEGRAAQASRPNGRAERPPHPRRHAGAPARLVRQSGEADLVRTFGMEGIGVFRTELQFLAEKVRPSEDALVASYRQAVEAQGGRPIAFRLLDVMASTHGETRQPERNPTMGQRGVRGCWRTMTCCGCSCARSCAPRRGRTASPCWCRSSPRCPTCSASSRRCSKSGSRCARRVWPCASRAVAIAPVIEIPAAAMQLGALLNESDFAVVAVDDLQAHLLAADRDNAAVREYHELVHPAVFELLARMAKDAERREKALVLFGESAADPLRMPFYVGVGFRSFSLAPVRLRAVLKVLARYSVEECRKIAARILEAPRALDVQKVLVNLDVG
jgi:phosphoenolpyruvate-protein kinase (PTS system EI component)